MNNKDILYFAYGANLNRDGMNNRCPGCKPLSRASLLDHRLVFRGVADIEFRAFETVQGALYHITLEHLVTLDRFEGYPRFYKRKIIKVTDLAGSTHEALVYQMDGRTSYSTPFTGYLDSIITGCRDWGIPDEYIQSIINRSKEP